MKQPTSIRSPEQSQDCFLLAAVCDVRGFSTLQDHIDEYIESSLTLDGRGDKIAEANREFMASTRKRAWQIFRKSLLSLGDDANELRYALKSTGDGFLVAVEIWSLDGKVWDRKNYPPYWKKRAWALKVVPKLDKVIANLKLVPLRSNASKKAKVGVEEVALARRLRAAGLLDESDLAAVERAASAERFSTIHVCLRALLQSAGKGTDWAASDARGADCFGPD